jgi:hypothetical protein
MINYSILVSQLFPIRVTRFGDSDAIDTASKNKIDSLIIHPRLMSWPQSPRSPALAIKGG